MQKKIFCHTLFAASFFVCSVYGMQWLKKTTPKNSLPTVQKTVRKPISNLQKRIDSYMRGRGFTTSAFTPAYSGHQILPKRNILTRTLEYFKSGKSFQQQEDLRNRINTTLLTSIIENNWDYNKTTTPRFLANAQEYLNKPLFDGKTLLERAFTDYLHVDEVKKIIQSTSSPQEIADKLYNLFFPAYKKNEEYAQRDFLNAKRRDILEYIDALLNLHASIGPSNVKAVYNLLLTQHCVSLFLQASTKQLHHGINRSDFTPSESIEPLLQRINERIKRFAAQENINFEKLNLQAYAQAKEIVTKCGNCIRPTSAPSFVEDL